MARLSPYQRIMRAADRGTGVRLDFRDVAELAADVAIQEAALNDDPDDLEDEVEPDQRVGSPRAITWGHV